MLSGSGGACFALFAAEADARAFVQRLDGPSGAAVHVVPFASGETWTEAPAP
jgi:4-diphosphocytidyl-2C-methyl-D-erythritol kinase